MRVAAVFAVVASAVLFVLSHELPPAGGDFDTRYVVARFAFPGAAMSAACFAIGPVFVVSGHCAAHFLIPSLFV